MGSQSSDGNGIAGFLTEHERRRDHFCPCGVSEHTGPTGESSESASGLCTTNIFQQTSNELVASMYQRQNELYDVCMLPCPILQPRLTNLQRVQDLDHSFSGLESKAETLHAAQIRQAQMQAHLHNQTQVEMQASRSLIANVTSSARGLHEAVDDAAAKIANMTWFGAIPKELFRFGWLVLAVAVLHWYSPNHAKFVATIIGEFPRTTEPSIADSKPQDSQPLCMSLVC